VKKTIAAAALLISLVAVGCSNNSATPKPASEAPAAAVESIAAEVEGAAESQVAEVEDAAASVAADVEGAVESIVAAASPAV
jgi:PBP1b-binding outer membrane lipoprotein LpoB